MHEMLEEPVPVAEEETPEEVCACACKSARTEANPQAVEVNLTGEKLRVDYDINGALDDG